MPKENRYLTAWVHEPKTVEIGLQWAKQVEDARDDAGAAKTAVLGQGGAA
jgi:hypothetical protein